MQLGDLGKIVTGKTPSTKNSAFWDGTVPFVTPKDIQGLKHIEQTERYITKDGLDAVKGSIIPPKAVCVSCIGNIGYVGMTTVECVSNQQINSIIVNENNNADFVYYLIKSLWPFFKNYEGQSTTLSILNKTQFSKIEVDVPDLKAQERIAAILSSIDEKIAINQKINDNLAA
ncbi:MAG: restriction endonuclease subunit S [Clostridiales bacterium]|nr:restriction endonuclease subunit S [Clostridiales bacterium]